MEALSFYHGTINKEMGEKILCATKEDGSYLIRKSESMSGAYCLCILFKGLVYTYRVYQTNDRLWVAELFAVKKMLASGLKTRPGNAVSQANSGSSFCITSVYKVLMGQTE
ncbi:SH2 domain-containing protein 1A isoform X1 [Paramormyrops kingsleyae]|uniref:SH2 domain-containing protein 1A isoform X1 n=1 Tax=Paramormyrops kingsleyae TaxID=1676925 RepID=UPI000CD6387B|nr:SH2 domain-containing protein 1A isoform X1 [Paramormyrops kingsleyae]